MDDLKLHAGKQQLENVIRVVHILSYIRLTFGVSKCKANKENRGRIDNHVKSNNIA